MWLLRLDHTWLKSVRLHVAVITCEDTWGHLLDTVFRGAWECQLVCNRWRAAILRLTLSEQVGKRAWQHEYIVNERRLVLQEVVTSAF